MKDLKAELEALKAHVNDIIDMCGDDEYEEEESEEVESDDAKSMRDEGNAGKQSSGKKESVGKIIALMGK